MRINVHSVKETCEPFPQAPVPLPAAFLRQMNELIGEEGTHHLAEALAEAPPVSVRLNCSKGGTAPAGAEEVGWCRTGRYLPTRPTFTLDPLLHAGCYYVQEAASMFVEQAFMAMAERPRRLLDLCAAPGGKSTLWRSLLADGALLVANEPVHGRAMILAENMAKWGHPDVVVTNAWPADFAPMGGFFDVVAADVPCSGEGMFRKDDGAVAEWSPENVAMCASRQRQIITDVWPALREGGYLVYSTCTFNRHEDEDNVAWICHELGAEPVEIPLVSSWHVTTDLTGRGMPVYRFLPGRTRGEGFFLALLRKTAPAELRRERRKKARPCKQTPVQGGKTAAAWLADAGDFKLFRPSEAHIAAVRQSLFDDVERVCATVRAVSAGILVAEEKGRKLVPRHELALSIQLAGDAFPRAELSPDEALAYLRREVLTLPPDVARGYVVATFEDRPLGFLNNLGSRANNLYPSEWRIRKL